MYAPRRTTTDDDDALENEVSDGQSSADCYVNEVTDLPFVL